MKLKKVIGNVGLLALLAGLLMSSHAAQAQRAGELDRGFAGIGQVAVPTREGGYAYSSAVDRHDRVVVVTTEHYVENGQFVAQYAVARYLPDGRPDPSFGAGQPVRLSPMTGGAIEAQVALDDRQRILVVGGTYAATLFAWRIREDGQPDLAYGEAGTGRAEVSLPGSSFAWEGGFIGMTVVRGQVLIACSPVESNLAAQMTLVRLTEDGRPDETLRGTGIAKFRVGSSPIEYAGATSVLVDDRQRIVLTGFMSPSIFSGAHSFAAVRVHWDGTYDTGFNGTGTVEVRHPSSKLATSSQFSRRSAIDPLGNIVMAGSLCTDSVLGNCSVMAVRLRDDGRPDGKFTGGISGVPGIGLYGGNGRMGGVSCPAVTPANALALSGDQVVIGGGCKQSPFDVQAFLFRLDREGNLDASFGVPHDFTYFDLGRLETESQFMHLTLDGKQRILATGYSNAFVHAPSGNINPAPVVARIHP